MIVDLTNQAIVDLFFPSKLFDAMENEIPGKHTKADLVTGEVWTLTDVMNRETGKHLTSLSVFPAPLTLRHRDTDSILTGRKTS